MVQWLKPCAPNAGGTGSIFGLGIKIPHSLQCDQKERKKRSISSKLGVYQRRTKTLMGKDTGTPVFITALFTTARIWRQPKRP